MRRTAALAVVSLTSLGLAVGACTKEPPPMPSACTDAGHDGYQRALAAAPGAVALPGGVPISSCTQRVRTDADLQNLGAIVHGVAEDLAERARGDGTGAPASADALAAALQLGFLAGAIGAGAERSNGISAELARRVETTGVGLGDADRGGPAVARALARGAAAGRERG
jgi:hypothetical protein